MIIATSGRARYGTAFTNGAQVGCADATMEKGGGGAGFRPHELLEASLACCMNMWLRMYADAHGVPLHSVVTRVVLDRSNPEVAAFRYRVELDGPLTAEQRDKLLSVAASCPVSGTLGRAISVSCAGSSLAMA